MRIVVIGGGGVVGCGLVAALRQRGHDVDRLTLTRHWTPGSLSRQLKGAASVIDLTLTDDGLDVDTVLTPLGARDLAEGIAAAGIPHHVMLAAPVWPPRKERRYEVRSVDLDQVTLPVHRTVVRATPLFEDLHRFADGLTCGTTVHVPPVNVQPLAARDVVDLLVRVAEHPPQDATIEIGGPEQFPLEAVLGRLLGINNDPRRIAGDRSLPVDGFDSRLMAGSDAELGAVTLADWLAHKRPHASESADPPLAPNEFRVSELPTGSVMLLGPAAVFGVEGGFCATQAVCTHRAGPLSEGTVNGTTVTCPLHGAQFDIWTGAVIRGPATQPLRTFPVVIDGDIGRVEL